MGDAGSVFFDGYGVFFGIFRDKIAPGFAGVFKSPLNLSKAAKTCDKEAALIGGDVVMDKITVLRKQWIGFYLHPDIGEPGRNLGKLVFHPAVLKFRENVLRIVEPPGGLVDLFGVIELGALTRGNGKTAGKNTAFFLIGDSAGCPVADCAHKLGRITGKGKKPLRLVVIGMAAVERTVEAFRASADGIAVFCWRVPGFRVHMDSSCVAFYSIIA